MKVYLPRGWTAAKVRMNPKGEIQILMNPEKLGSGSRFAACVASVKARGGAYDPEAVCAAAGRKKYGSKKMASLAAAGRKRRPR